MKWMIDTDFFQSDIAIECTMRATRTDSAGVARISILIQLLSLCVNGISFESCDYFCHRVKAQKKQCQRVWDICLKRNVLRGDPENGYSTIEWMRENGYFKDDWKDRKQYKQRVQNQQAEQTRQESRCSFIGAASSSSIVGTLAER